jgi:hypothetical protein
MRLSSRLILVCADDTLSALDSAAFMRMLRREAVARLPDFAGQRVRQASLDVELVNGKPSRVVRCTFSIMDIDGNGLLDVDRWTAQQFARVGDPLASAGLAREPGSMVVDAATRFVARGGSWEPDRLLMRRIEAAALGQLACPPVRVVR